MDERGRQHWTERGHPALALLLCAWMVTLTPPLLAQERVEAVLEDVGGGESLELTAPGLWLSDVTVRSIGADSVQVTTQGAVVSVAFAEIQSLAVLRNRKLSGALLGSGAGLLAGGLFGGMIRSFGCRDPALCTRDERRGALLGGLTGALVGAALGLWIGSSSTHWEPVFP